jgi:hypothetical protein
MFTPVLSSRTLKIDVQHDACQIDGTGVYESDWAGVMYLNKGVLGVEQKQTTGFHVSAVYGFDAYVLMLRLYGFKAHGA